MPKNKIQCLLILGIIRWRTAKSLLVKNVQPHAFLHYISDEFMYVYNNSTALVKVCEASQFMTLHVKVLSTKTNNPTF